MTCLKSFLNVSAAGLLLTQSLPMADAGEVLNAYVDHQRGHYLLNLEMRIDAPQAQVYEVLLDFNAITELNDSIKVSRLLNNHDKQYTVLLVSEGCIWIFCRRVKQVQVVTEKGRGYLQSITDPTQSDMASGKVLWHVRADAEQVGQTLITYSADFEPDFFVPPLIGPWIMKKRLLEEGMKTVDGIEEKAQDESE